MKIAITTLEPKSVWGNFNELNSIPRASKKEERVIAFMLDFAKRIGLEAEKDAVGNVLIRKAATAGMEGRKTVVLQSHLDMVHQKNADSDFDFDSQGIDMYVDGDWVKARGTTLGADNGIGVAAIMALLASTDIAHPALEALFTIDEETGMTGAKGLQPDFLKGDILLNLDTEEDTEIDIGCAGGIDVTARRAYTVEKADGGLRFFKLTVDGLQGGHSGMDIHKGLGNANKLIARLLFSLEEYGLRISKIDGGGLRNAIPREGVAVFACEEGKVELLKERVEEVASFIKQEYAIMEPALRVEMEEVVNFEGGLVPVDVQSKLLRALYVAPNGVYRMSAGFADLVETSNNIARVLVKDGEIVVKCLTRSSVESSKMDLADTLKAGFELMEAEVSFSGDYPGWTPNPNSEILDLLNTLYSDLFAGKAEVVSCHAGLECGLLGRYYPDMEMISFGPTILGAHSPQERVSISSVQKFWKFLCAILANIPHK
ncbi:aminoacyl-histidine dipeptidase [Sphingobacterium sp. UT-1RO-CII-1]|uniref:aminoacyl-histidine dipeptidase n=1 Tax=Sphingobacterium sp. UT-1RO-CII-1 TaxID=2995225 RepID=UPI00227D17EF|nr:aminoacyl-histidine dipeptidase [Sphingobacterium sp. UT-1RO-CII-1]MCY4780480.1 aminoacyl-histidine dipeptidase [Sphingobacterium sp. UT-1RO-CII-1]